MNTHLLSAVVVALCAFRFDISARDRAAASWPSVNLLVSIDKSVPIPLSLLSNSQGLASMIYSRVRIRLNWQSETGNDLQPPACGQGSTVPDFIVRFEPRAPRSLSHAALAMAMPYASSGVRIVIFYDRVFPLFNGHCASEATILSYVLAHEIGHVLQGINRHSDVGIMRARWTDSDFAEMGRGVLVFTREDEQLLRRRLSPGICDNNPRTDRASVP